MEICWQRETKEEELLSSNEMSRYVLLYVEIISQLLLIYFE